MIQDRQLAAGFIKELKIVGVLLCLVFSALSIQAQCTGFGVTTTFTPVTCFGGSNGTANAGIQNGTGPFTYTWTTSPVQTTATATGLASGTYQITVSDANSCTASAVVSVTEPPAWFHSSSFTPVSCFGGTDGTSAVTVNGSTPPYSYSWNTLPIQTTSNATGLSAGTWTLSVTDANSCPWSVAVVVSQPPAIGFTLTYVPVSCVGNSDGSASVTVLGGTPGFSYSWSTSPVQTTATATGLSVGTYNVAVTDGNGCAATSPPVSVLVSPSLNLTIGTQRVTCNGQSNGSASVLVSGGNPGYSYVWNTVPVQAVPIATGLSAGTYSLTVTDARGCFENRTVLITEPLPLNVSVTATDVACFGQNTGAVSGSGSGGTLPYVYTWNTSPVQTVQTVTGLGAGAYTMTITDSSGCVASGVGVVRQPLPLTVQTTYVTPDCYGGNNGQVIANVSGGVPAYTYLWSGGQTSSTAIGLIAGTYEVIVTDGNGCRDTLSQILPEPPPLILGVQGTNLICMGPPDNGTAWATPSGGTSPYSYLWTGGLTPTQAFNSGLAAGTWGVQVTDARGCTSQDQVVLLAPNRPVVQAGRDTFFCEGSGGIGLSGSATGGTPPYTYWWQPNNGSLSNTFSPTPWANPDTTTVYSLYVTDAAGCSALLPDQVIVSVVTLPVVDAGPDETYCEDGPAVFISGSVTNPLSGGYEYTWTPATGLFCNTCPTTYTSPNTTTIYTLRVRHILSGCTSDSTTLNANSSVVVTVKPRPIVYAGQDTSICQGDSASLCAVATGVGPLYFYDWSPGLGMNNTTLQCPNTSPPHTTLYFVIATSDGCESPADSVLVQVIPIPVVDAGNTKNICPGDSIRLDGVIQQGFQAQITWSPVNGLSNPNILQPMASPASTQWYYLSTNNAGCGGGLDSVLVIVRPRPLVDAGLDTTICDTLAGLQLKGNYTGVPLPVQIEWTPAGTLSASNILQPQAHPGSSTLYYLTVSSGAPPTRCSATDSVLVTVLPSINLVVSQDTDKMCVGGQIPIHANAGSGNATFVWTPALGLSDPQSADPVASPMVPTTYIVAASEGQCTMWDSVRIYVHPEVRAAFSFTQPEGCGAHSVQFLNLSSGGLLYHWDFGDSSATSNEILVHHEYDRPGIFYPILYVRGAGGCADTLTSATPIRIYPEYRSEVVLHPVVPLELTLPDARVSVQENSPATEKRIWDFGDGTIGTPGQAQHTYDLPGTYHITLNSWDSLGCLFTWKSPPIVVKSPELFVPNVFTPNGDGIQDFFRVEYSGHELYLLQIYDRWGVKQFETRNQNQFWDGLDMNGQPVPEGVYFWHIGMGSVRHSGQLSVLR